MIVIEKKAIPIYRATCYECHSVMEYKKSEISFGYITCPVCGASVLAIGLVPYRYEEVGDIHG